jgi:hypothetical protein
MPGLGRNPGMGLWRYRENNSSKLIFKKIRITTILVRKNPDYKIHGIL